MGKLDYKQKPKLTKAQLFTTGVKVQGCVTIADYGLLLTLNENETMQLQTHDQLPRTSTRRSACPL